MIDLTASFAGRTVFRVGYGAMQLERLHDRRRVLLEHLRPRRKVRDRRGQLAVSSHRRGLQLRSSKRLLLRDERRRSL